MAWQGRIFYSLSQLHQSRAAAWPCLYLLSWHYTANGLATCTCTWLCLEKGVEHNLLIVLVALFEKIRSMYPIDIYTALRRLGCHMQSSLVRSNVIQPVG